MLRYVLRRLVLAIPTALGAVTIIFVALRVIPGDPAQILLGSFATPESVRALREELGFDRPILTQYLEFLAGIARGQFGRSVQSRLPVLEQVLAVLPYTLSLAVAAVLLSLVIGIPIGILAARKRNTLPDFLITTTTLFGVSMPVFWLGILLVLVFAIRVSWLPASGIAQSANPLEQLQYLFLPSLALGLSLTGMVIRMTRSAMLDVLGQDYIRTARSKGLAWATVVYGHALKNAMLPVITALGVVAGQLLGGSVLVETVFARPGVGKLLVDSVFARDYPQVQGVVTVFALTFILMNLVVDLSYAYFDPRIKFR